MRGIVGGEVERVNQVVDRSSLLRGRDRGVLLYELSTRVLDVLQRRKEEPSIVIRERQLCSPPVSHQHPRRGKKPERKKGAGETHLREDEVALAVLVQHGLGDAQGRRAVGVEDVTKDGEHLSASFRVLAVLRVGDHGVDEGGELDLSLGTRRVGPDEGDFRGGELSVVLFSPPSHHLSEHIHKD